MNYNHRQLIYNRIFYGIKIWGYHKLEGTVDKIYEDFVHLNLSTLKYRILQKRITQSNGETP